MTTTLKLYTLPINLLDKNFKMDSWSTYLLTLTPVVKSDFQYQRFDLEATIKVNLSQDYQNQLITKFNYVSITAKISNTDYTYYYFVKKFKQIAQATIELELYMDVLNTFTYTLSPKSLITREHKDRLKVNNDYLYQFNTPSQNEPYHSFTLIDEIPVTQMDGVCAFIIIDSNGKIIYRIRFDEFEVTRDLLNNLQLNLYFNGTLVYNKVFSQISGTPILSLNSNSYNILDGLIIFDYCYRPGYYRIIDRFQEGIETYLFKNSEEELLDEDIYKTYFLVYSTLNNVDSSVDYEPVYKNPIKIGICENADLTITTKSATLVTIYCESDILPKIKDNKECMVVRKSQLASPNYLRIGGVNYDDSSFPAGKDCIVIIRKNNKDVLYESIDFATIGTNSEGFEALYSPTSIATNIDSVGFYGIDEVEWGYAWYIYADGTGGEAFAVYLGVSQCPPIYIGSGTSALTDTILAWKNRDLTNPKLMKAINYPYCPNEWLVGKGTIKGISSLYTLNATDKILELQDSQVNDFDRQIHFNAKNPISYFNAGRPYRPNETRKDFYESKIYHSDFFNPKFVYDSYGFSYQLENVNIDTYLNNFSLEDFIVRYVISANVLSKFMFQFIQYTCDRAVTDYENVLIIDRNNEKALYTNAYIQYIKSGGYAYDTKKANSQNAVNGIMTGLSIAGGVASFVGGAVSSNPLLAVAGVGLITSSAGSIVRNIHTAQEQDRAISQKLLQASNQASSVSGVEDIDILTAFTNNKAKMCYYGPSDIMKKAVLDLFYYCGYATHEQKTPVTNTRLYFNFIQGDIIIKDYHFNDDIYEEIHNCYLKGVTYMHYVNGAYDFNQEKENFETSLLS